MNEKFMYDVGYISGRMSLRRPQKKSLEILDDILKHIKPTKNTNLDEALKKINSMYPTCVDFERNFVSLSFVLATGVGKTRLMGAFIAYLYAKFGIKNFFVVAPGATVYNKLKQDLSDQASPKYVFSGLGCFDTAPQIIADDDYRNRVLPLYESDVKIFVFNIDKFNKENVKMRAFNEYLGDSFFNQLAKMEDLVMIMDEAHHYHADKGAMALNELKPILGLELTATPYYNVKSKQEKFKNAVYEYPLSQSIKDGYTRTPYAVTRKDIKSYNFGDDEIDKIMLSDGILCHENIKQKLESYANNNNIKKIKPFVMVVCKDTEHATQIYNYITSIAFFDGRYDKSKTLLIHSNQKTSEREENVKLLLDVELADNPIEIVIHVDMLKEGWDVNNLYTIVPLRTAASKILREQMVGRGLRLPYGKRVDDKKIDSVMLTAHDKFDEIILDAQSQDSIFNVKNIIDAQDLQKQELITTQLSINFEECEAEEELDSLKLEKSEKNKNFITQTRPVIRQVVRQNFTKKHHEKNTNHALDINKKVTEVIKQNKDLSEIYEENQDVFRDWIVEEIKTCTKKTIDKFIPIPQLTITDNGLDEYRFMDFDLDLSEFNHVPVSNEILIQNLNDSGDRIEMKGGLIDFDVQNPIKMLIGCLREKPEIDYEKCSELIQKLVKKAIKHYEDKFKINGMKNIIMMNKKDIADKIYHQMLQENHFYYTNGLIEEKIVSLSDSNLAIDYSYSAKMDLYNSTQNIANILFTNIKKGVFSEAKFDSMPELTFARIIEQDKDVLNWLRPNINEFKLYYNRFKRYQPDFVVETKDIIYLVEVKGENMMSDPDVIAKKERAVKYCKIATEWGKANGYKEWKYLFIPAGEISAQSSFSNLANRFVVVEN